MNFAVLLLVLVPADALTVSRRHSFGLGAAGAAALGSALPAAAGREGSTKSGLRFRVEVEGSGDTPKRGQQALLDYVLRVGVDGKPPLYVDGTKQTFPARRQQCINQIVAARLRHC